MDRDERVKQWERRIQQAQEDALAVLPDTLEDLRVLSPERRQVVLAEAEEKARIYVDLLREAIREFESDGNDPSPSLR